MAMKTIIHCAAFVAVALALAVAIEQVVPDDEYAVLLQNELGQGAEIVYFGDSVIAYSDPHDLDKRLLTKMVEEELGDGDIIAIHQGAFYLRIYGAYVEFIASQEKKPKVIVVPISLRSFGPQWDARPGYQFSSEIYRISPQHSQIGVLWDRIKKLSDNSNEREKDEERWMSQPVYFNTTVIGTVKDFHYGILGDEKNKEELIREKFVYNYLFALQQNQRNLDSLKHIITLAKENNVGLVLYIEPIDYRAGEKAVGPKFIPLVRGNIDVIRKTAEREDAVLYDFSQSLNSSAFSYAYIPDEHLNEDGKKELSRLVVSAIRKEKGKSIA